MKAGRSDGSSQENPGGASPSSGRRWLAFPAPGAERFGVVGLYLFAAGYVGAKALANIGLAIVVAAFVVAVARDPRRWMGDAMLRLGLAWLCYLLALAGWRALNGMEGSLLQPENLCLAMIPAIAWSVGRSGPRIGTALVLGLTGLMVKLAFDVRSLSWPWFDYSDTPFMLGVNRNISSLMLNTAIVGVLLSLWVLIRQLWHGAAHPRRALLELAGAGVLLAVLILPWAASPSRTLWLSLVAVVAVIVARSLPGRGRWVRIGATFLLVGAVIASMTYSDHFGAILTREIGTWRLLLSGEWSVVPDGSSGFRFRMLQMGLARLADNPWTGVVNGGAQILRQHPEFPLSHAVQLHNGYLEILVRTGVIGLAFFACAIVLASRAASRAARVGDMPWVLGELLLAGLLLFLFVNLTNGVVFFQHGWQFLVLFAGIAWSYQVRPAVPRRPRGSRTSSTPPASACASANSP